MNIKIWIFDINFFFLSKVKTPLFFSRHLKENIFKMVNFPCIYKYRVIICRLNFVKLNFRNFQREFIIDEFGYWVHVKCCVKTVFENS
jgi:hypothetical protein